MKGAKPEHAVLIQRAIEAVMGVLRSRLGVFQPVKHAARASYRQARVGTVTALPLRPFGTSERAALFQSFDACGVVLRPAGSGRVINCGSLTRVRPQTVELRGLECALT